MAAEDIMVLFAILNMTERKYHIEVAPRDFEIYQGQICAKRNAWSSKCSIYNPSKPV